MSQPSPRRVRPPQEGKTTPARGAAAATLSRRSLSKWDREQRNTRVLVLSGAALVSLVVLILAWGWVLDNVLRANDVAALVNGDTITTRQLVEEMRPDAQAIEVQAQQAPGSVPRAQVAQYVEQEKRKLVEQAQGTLVDQHILQKEAAQRGIAVTPEEVDQRLRESVATYEAQRNPQPTPEAATDPASPTASPEAVGSPTPIPTLEQAAYDEALKRLLSDLGLTEQRLRTTFSRNLLREKLGTAIAGEATQEQIHARHILLPDEEKAKEALAKLEGGADFAELAKQESTDTSTKDKGGDLGWFPRGAMVEAFQEAAFGLQPGQRSGIVQSQFGFHIIEVLERDSNRPMDEQQLRNARAQAVEKLLGDRRNSPDVKPDLSNSERDWALRQIGVRP
jgi:parvulin-like peptidyl-prolyl isomerase